MIVLKNLMGILDNYKQNACFYLRPLLASSTLDNKLIMNANFEAFQNDRFSQGGRGNFTKLLEGQIHFSLKLFVGCPIKQF